MSRRFLRAFSSKGMIMSQESRQSEQLRELLNQDFVLLEQSYEQLDGLREQQETREQSLAGFEQVLCTLKGDLNQLWMDFLEQDVQEIPELEIREQQIRGWLHKLVEQLRQLGEQP
jgi:hypothetical protein